MGPLSGGYGTSMKTEVGRDGRAKKYTNKSSRDNTVNLEIFVVKIFS